MMTIQRNLTKALRKNDDDDEPIKNESDKRKSSRGNTDKGKANDCAVDDKQENKRSSRNGKDKEDDEDNTSEELVAQDIID